MSALELKRFSLLCGSRMLLKDVDACWPRRHLTALLGRNGAGKSTLLRAIVGLNPDYEGTIKVDGNDIRNISSTMLARSLAMVTTERIRVQSLSCFDAVAMGRAPYTGWRGMLTETDREIVARALSTVGMSSFADRMLDNMSDGERQRIMVARALAQDTPVLLLDEPTSFLDLPARHQLCDLLRRLAHSGDKCVIFSTHELDLALKYADSVAVFHKGELLTVSTDAPEVRQLLGNVFELDNIF